MQSVIIVGGGIAGMSLAYQMRSFDIDVTVLEKDALGSGTTGKSVAVFDRYIHRDEVGREIVKRSWDTYGPLADDGLISFTQHGFIQVAESAEHMGTLETHADVLNEIGVETIVLSPSELEPHHLDSAEIGSGAIYLPEIGRVDPGEILPVFAEAARKAGSTIETGVRVTDVLVDGGQVVGVETTSGVVKGDAVVNATGPWANQFNEMAGVSLPLKHYRQPLVVLQVPDHRAIPIVVFENGHYVVPDTPGTYLWGFEPLETTMTEFFDRGGIEVDPDAVQPVPEEYRNEVAEMAGTVFPFLRDSKMVEEWNCIPCVTPDRYPLVGETNVHGFFVMNGMSGAGITRSPGVASILAERLASGETSDVLDQLSPYRFDDRYY